MFSLCTRSYHDTRRWRDASRCNSEHFDFLDPRPPWPCLSESRYGAVGKIGLHMEFSRSPWAHSHTTIQGGGVTPPGAIRNTLIFWTPAAMARGLARQDTVPWAKLAYTWNFHVLLVHTLIPRYKEVA
ncbi:hypothetical protein QL285_058464 [Trifolium repens]|nr:hypothetical protein QL285_058464 [Trifolium repens]